MSNPHDLFRAAICPALEALGVSIEERHIERLFTHFQAMAEANHTVNLTRITDPQVAAVKHYADSLALIPWIKQHQSLLVEQGVSIRSVLDIGTGAGFPAIPLAIMKPNWDIAAIDGTRKKVDFVRRICTDLHVKNVTPIHAHSKYYETDEPFDLVVSRAVGALTKCLTASAMHVRPGGVIVAYKTPAAIDEQKDAASTARALHLEAIPPFAYQLPLRGELLERILVVYSKQR